MNKVLKKKSRKTKKSKPEQTQNLRSVSMHIKNVIARNPNISIKVLSYIIYEITVGTSIGKNILQSDYPPLNEGVILYLIDKYREMGDYS